MSTLEYAGIPAADLDRIRRDRRDDFGNHLVDRPAEPGLPLRCCLRLSTAGERIALIAFRPSSLGGPYAEIGPVFIHTGSCPGHATDVFPPDFAGRRAVLRPYDAAGLMLAGRLAEPGESLDGLERLFADPRVASVHVRNVVAGCWNFTVRRSPDLE
jgi:hypothetical protein